ncbi:hypothetical protein F5Y19DRAFT_475206 [Xylariaceae sp. FL1651]|nr:hypothetical protein F5Y19DRAFT_475206 [Xylariaceae sp. FL1651]
MAFQTTDGTNEAQGFPNPQPEQIPTIATQAATTSNGARPAEALENILRPVPIRPVQGAMNRPQQHPATPIRAFDTFGYQPAMSSALANSQSVNDNAQPPSFATTFAYQPGYQRADEERRFGARYSPDFSLENFYRPVNSTEVNSGLLRFQQGNQAYPMYCPEPPGLYERHQPGSFNFNQSDYSGRAMFLQSSGQGNRVAQLGRTTLYGMNYPSINSQSMNPQGQYTTPVNNGFGHSSEQSPYPDILETTAQSLHMKNSMSAGLNRGSQTGDTPQQPIWGPHTEYQDHESYIHSATDDNSSAYVTPPGRNPFRAPPGQQEPVVFNAGFSEPSMSYQPAANPPNNDKIDPALLANPFAFASSSSSTAKPTYPRPNTHLHRNRQPAGFDTPNTTPKTPSRGRSQRPSSTRPRVLNARVPATARVSKSGASRKSSSRNKDSHHSINQHPASALTFQHQQGTNFQTPIAHGVQNTAQKLNMDQTMDVSNQNPELTNTSTNAKQQVQLPRDNIPSAFSKQQHLEAISTPTSASHQAYGESRYDMWNLGSYESAPNPDGMDDLLENHFILAGGYRDSHDDNLEEVLADGYVDNHDDDLEEVLAGQEQDPTAHTRTGQEEQITTVTADDIDIDVRSHEVTSRLFEMCDKHVNSQDVPNVPNHIFTLHQFAVAEALFRKGFTSKRFLINRKQVMTYVPQPGGSLKQRWIATALVFDGNKLFWFQNEGVKLKSPPLAWPARPILTFDVRDYILERVGAPFNQNMLEYAQHIAPQYVVTDPVIMERGARAAKLYQDKAYAQVAPNGSKLDTSAIDGSAMK